MRGRRTEIARGGVYATYHGQSTDHFDDGTFAIVLQIELSTGPWLVDARDTAFHPIGEHCVRLVSSSGDRAELDVALQPAHAYDAARCHAACCRDHTPAPDGTIECCFCSDAP